MRRRKAIGEQGDKGITISIYVDSSFVGQVDALADKIGVTRSQMFRNLAVVGYEDAKILDAFGLFTLMRKIEDMRKDFHGSSEQLQPA